MKIELILLGVIGLVFLIDFIMNSRKKPSIDNVVDQIEGGEPVKTNNPLNYLLKRKKNFTIYILSIPVIKVLIHFFIYKERGSKITNLFRPWQKKGFDEDLAHHIDITFKEELILFVPAFILVSLVVWFFNDKIKAR
jgi:hypothetical protein